MQSFLSLLILFVGLVAATPVHVKRTTVVTPLGSITGTPTISGVERFVFKYASQPRWQPPQVVTTMTSLSTLPPVCAQPTLDGSGNWIGVEDCQYITLYSPNNRNGTALVWFHGGSLLAGGANDPAIEASKLALATGSVVAVVQYRLGVLGWLPPASNTSATNLGVRDAILALNVLNQVFNCINVNKVTIGGHSAGSMLVRALLAAPSASGYFNKTVLLSDPMAYGFYNSSTITTLQNNFFPSVGCTTTNSTCHNALSLGDIMDAQIAFNPVAYDASTAGQIPFRPSKDGVIITSSLTTSFPSTLKPLLVTTAHDEAGVFIYGSLGTPLPEAYFSLVLSNIIPDPRATAIEASPHYALNSSDSDTVRKTLKNIITDLGWRCSSQYFAKAWASGGGNVWTAETLRGVAYSANINVDFCTDSETHVCHQNDIQVVFGTTSSPSTAVANLTTEIQARLKGFFANTNPNKSGYSTWNKTTSSALNLLPLGSGLSVTPAGACSDLWGTSAAQFDWQMFGL